MGYCFSDYPKTNVSLLSNGKCSKKYLVDLELDVEMFEWLPSVSQDMAILPPKSAEYTADQN